MERSEISAHEIRVYQAVKRAGRWVTNHEIAAAANVAPRTARAHSHKLTKLGIFEQAEVFPSLRFRVSPMAHKRNGGYLDRLQRAIEILGGSL